MHFPGVSEATGAGQLRSRECKVCKITVTAVPRVMVVCLSAALL